MERVSATDEDARVKHGQATCNGSYTRTIWASVGCECISYFRGRGVLVPGRVLVLFELFLLPAY